MRRPSRFASRSRRCSRDGIRAFAEAETFQSPASVLPTATNAIDETTVYVPNPVPRCVVRSRIAITLTASDAP